MSCLEQQTQFSETGSDVGAKLRTIYYRPTEEQMPIPKRTCPFLKYCLVINEFFRLVSLFPKAKVGLVPLRYGKNGSLPLVSCQISCKACCWASFLEKKFKIC